MHETRVLICSGHPPLSWVVDNDVCSVKQHFNRKGILSPKASLLKPAKVGSCKVTCTDRYDNSAETSSVIISAHNKTTAKNAHAGIFLGTEIRKQIGKEYIFRRRYSKQEKYPYHTPTNRQHLEKQQPWRQLFAAAMAAALSLAPSEREKWRLDNLRFHWFNNYIKWWLKQQPKPW